MHKPAIILLAWLAPHSLLSQDSTFVPGYKAKTGKEIVAVYVGSSHCGPCRMAEYKSNLQKALVRIAKEAKDAGKSFWALGIAADEDIAAGLEFIKESGQFDEITTGRAWRNTAMNEFIFLDEYSESSTPQLIVFERQVEIHGVGLKVIDRRILLRLSGTGDMNKWLAKNKSIAETKTYKGMIFK